MCQAKDLSPTLTVTKLTLDEGGGVKYFEGQYENHNFFNGKSEFFLILNKIALWSQISQKK
jgi:hypothetical protein